MADHYGYRVLWSQGDGQYVGLCAEFPGLSHLAADQIEALVGIRSLVNDVVAGMQQDEEKIPEKIPESLVPVNDCLTGALPNPPYLPET